MQLFKKQPLTVAKRRERAISARLSGWLGTGLAVLSIPVSLLVVHTVEMGPFWFFGALLLPGLLLAYAAGAEMDVSSYLWRFGSRKRSVALCARSVTLMSGVSLFLAAYAGSWAVGLTLALFVLSILVDVGFSWSADQDEERESVGP